MTPGYKWKMKNKFESVRIKNIWATNNTTKKVEGKSAEWEKMLANHISEKRLTFRIHSEFSQINSM